MRAGAACLLALCQAAILSPAAAGTTATVHPSGASVPENLLRIEVRFAPAPPTPLQLDQLRLLDQRGEEIEGAFLDLMLPSADGRRVTILMHPGRVKSGVGANLALGRALHAGSTVTLVVSHPSLAGPLTKTWTVTASDTDPPQPGHWTFDAPPPRSREALLVHLDKPISSTAEVLIAVRDARGRRVGGSASLENGETLWRFIPSRPWRAGSYALVTHPDLEDAAGNRACAAFELAHENNIRCEAGTSMPFEVRRRLPKVGAQKHFRAPQGHRRGEALP